MKPCVAAITWTRVRGKFGGNRSKESGRSGASFSSQKISPKPIAPFRWKRARLSLLRPQPHLPSFIQIHQSFPDLLAKTTFQIVTIIGDPIGYRIADNKSRAVKRLSPGVTWPALSVIDKTYHLCYT